MALDLYKYVASIPDYPEKGIVFRDILPLMADGEAFKQATDEITAFARERQVDMVVGPEARGFIVGCPVAYKLGSRLCTSTKERQAASGNGQCFLSAGIWRGNAADGKRLC